MNETNHSKCIYCKSTGPFSEEHVFPAGMGGDDKNFILLNLVCKNCNTGIFSKLELSLMRRSPIAIGRKFLQTRTRTKGLRTSRPTVETKTHFIIDEEGRLLEAEYDSSGKETILAQFIIEDGKIYYTARDQELLEKIYQNIRSTLDTPNINLIIKKKIDTVYFEIETYDWLDGEYKLSSTEVRKKPPVQGIWLENFSGHETDFPPRFFQKLSGQLILRTSSNIHPAKLLRGMRRTLPSMLIDKDEAVSNSIQQPIVQIQMEVDADGVERALAKIGMNFLAITFGPSFIDRPQFDSIKSSILTGNPELPYSSYGTNNAAAVRHLFGDIPEKCHCLMLIFIPTDDGLSEIYFNAVLYNTGAHRVFLAKKLPIAELTPPIYFLVNYETNTITPIPMLAYQLKYGVIL